LPCTAQPGLIAASGSAWVGILLAALGFVLQHLAFDLTLTSAVASAAGFTLWGPGAGRIALRQGRLFPLIIAHFISNLGGFVPLFFIVRGG